MTEAAGFPGAAARTAAFFAAWLVLSSADPGALLPGALAAAAAGWASLRLLPSTRFGLRPAALPGLAARFLRQSALGGADVAWRALSPRLPLDPGLVPCRLRLPPGAVRSAFLTEINLMPGTLTARQEGDGMMVHCLDRGRQGAAQIAEEEDRLLAALRAEPRHG